MKSTDTNFLKNLAADNISGSSQLLENINNWFIKNNFSYHEYEKQLKFIKESFGDFNIIINYAEQCEEVLQKHGIESLKLFQRNFKNIQEKEFAELIEKSIVVLKKYDRFVTISNSKTIESVFQNLSFKKKIYVAICESRPVFEGRLLAKKLMKTNAEIKLITEAMIPNEVEKTDAVVLGADKYFSNGDVVNKVGSRALALSAFVFHKAVFVITDKLKLSKKHIFESENRAKKEIWDSAPSGIKIENYYFEIIEKKFVTKLITN
ncbi:MAG: translation initiation factor eIF-2B [Ignavibacteriales bacterium]